jgi:hypothetical protein
MRPFLTGSLMRGADLHNRSTDGAGIVIKIITQVPAMIEREVVLDFVPRSQFLPFHKRKQRWACLICHRRCGKTFAN